MKIWKLDKIIWHFVLPPIAEKDNISNISYKYNKLLANTWLKGCKCLKYPVLIYFF